jgi:class 3 adenylate cyclase
MGGPPDSEDTDAALPEGGDLPASSLFRRYAWLMAAGAVLFVTGLAAQMTMQFDSWRASLISDIDIRIQAHVVRLDADMDATLSRIQGLRAIGESLLRRWRVTGPPYHPSMDFLAYDPAGDTFSMDSMALRRDEAAAKDLTNYGAVIGTGDWRRRDENFERELAMAMELIDLQALALGNRQLYVRAYYASGRNFIAAFPFTTAGELLARVNEANPDQPPIRSFADYMRALYERRIWKGAQPDVNPNGDIFRTLAYRDLSGGLMVTAGAPVREDGKVVGVLAADITVESLRGYMQQAVDSMGDIEGDRILLINSHRQILVDTRNPVGTEIPNVDQALSPAVAAVIDQAPRGQVTADGMLVFVRPLNHVPWKFVYLMPPPSLTGVFFTRVAAYVTVMGFALLFVLLVHLYVNRVFVRPAVGLVALIQQGEEARLPEEEFMKLPRRWRHWFALLQRSMRQRVEARRARDNLARYFSPNMVDRLAGRSRPFKEYTRQDVAALFADIRDFTGIAERNEPEWVIELLRGFHSRMAEEVFAQEGTLEKYIGDALLAIFGAPDTGPRDASHALLAARNMLLSLQAWNAERRIDGEQPVEVGFGLHWGPAVVGDVGSEQAMAFTVVGDTVNTANRLQSLAAGLGASLVVSAAFIDRVRAEGGASDPLVAEMLARLGPAGVHEMKGKQQRIDVYVLHGPL